MTITRLYLRQERDTTAPEDTIPISTGRPEAGHVTVTATDALASISFVATFWQGDVAAAAADAKLTGQLATPVFVVPAGFTARLYAMSLYVIGDGDDITACTAKLYVGGVDASADWGALTLNPAEDDTASALPTVAPFEITTGVVTNNDFEARVTTNGTGGTMAVQVQVYGYLFRNS